MRKIFKQSLTTATVVAMAATLVANPFGNTIFADGEEESSNIQPPTEATEDYVLAQLSPWTFFQTGTTTDAWNSWEKCAFGGVESSEGEIFTEADFPTGELADHVATGKTVTKTFENVADGFDATILSNGWSADYDAGGNLIDNNPYTVTASMLDITLDLDHKYTFSMNLSSSKNKIARVAIVDEYTNVIDAQTLLITPDGVEYTTTFTNYAGGNADLVISLGAFQVQQPS